MPIFVNGKQLNEIMIAGRSVAFGYSYGRLVFRKTQVNNVTFTINPTPADATVTINGVIRKTITVPVGTQISWAVEADGYYSRQDSFVAERDVTLDLILERSSTAVRLCWTAPITVGDNTWQGYIYTNADGSLLGSPAYVGPVSSPWPASWNGYIWGTQNRVSASNQLYHFFDVGPSGNRLYFYVESYSATQVTIKREDAPVRMTFTRAQQYDLSV